MEKLLQEFKPEIEKRTREHMGNLGCPVKNFSMSIKEGEFTVIVEIHPGNTGLENQLCFKHSDPGELIERIELLGKAAQA